MYQFNQPYRAHITQPQRSNYDNMGTKLNYGSAAGSNPLALEEKWLKICQDPRTNYLFLRQILGDPKHLREIVGDLEDKWMRQDVELEGVMIDRIIDFLFNRCVIQFYEIIL